jgi:hypothetical protein
MLDGRRGSSGGRALEGAVPVRRWTALDASTPSDGCRCLGVLIAPPRWRMSASIIADRPQLGSQTRLEHKTSERATRVGSNVCCAARGTSGSAGGTKNNL